MYFQTGTEEKGSKFMVQTPIWDFFKKTTTEAGDVRAVCNVCDKSLRFHNTSVMVRHLRYLHPKSYESYRSDYIQGRMGVGYDIRGGILGLPLTAPKRTRLRKSNRKSGETKKGQKEEVKRLILLKAKTEKEESCTITEKDLEQLGQRNIKILNISNKGTIPDIMGDQIIEDLRRGKQCVAVTSKFEGEQEIESENVEVSEGQFALKDGRQFKVVHVPAGYLGFIKNNVGEVVEGEGEQNKEGAEIFHILDEGETLAETTEQSDSELLQIWEQGEVLSSEHGVLVCSVDPNARRETTNVVIDESSAEGMGQVEYIIAN